MFSKINGLHGNLDELAVAASLFDIVFCCETKATGRCYARSRPNSGDGDVFTLWLGGLSIIYVRV